MYNYDYLPDPTEVSEIEDVVELGWCWQHLHLCLLPQLACSWHKTINNTQDVFREATLLKYKRAETGLLKLQHKRWFPKFWTYL